MISAITLWTTTASFSLKHDFSDNEFLLVLQVNPNLVSDEDNAILLANPATSEIKDVVFAMDSCSALGPDGFDKIFYQSCCDIVGKDVSAANQDFFKTVHLMHNLNSNFLILIPKT